MAWVQLVDDLFSADANPIGGGWVKAPDQGGHRVSSGVAWGIAAPGSFSVWTGASFSGKQYAQGPVNTNAGVTTRGSTAVASQGYLLYRPTASTLEIYRFDGSSMTKIGDTINKSTTNDSILRLESVGGTHTPFVDGVEVAGGARSDSTYLSGYPGIYCYGGNPAYGIFSFSAGHEPPERKRFLLMSMTRAIGYSAMLSLIKNPKMSRRELLFRGGQ